MAKDLVHIKGDYLAELPETHRILESYEWVPDEDSDKLLCWAYGQGPWQPVDDSFAGFLTPIAVRKDYKPIVKMTCKHCGWTTSAQDIAYAIDGPQEDGDPVLCNECGKDMGYIQEIIGYRFLDESGKEIYNTL